MDENEIVVEELDDETEVETPEVEPEEPERDNTLEIILGEFTRMNERINELESKIEEMLAPIRSFAQKDLPEANTSEASAPALYYL